MTDPIFVARPGEHIDAACERAAKLAARTGAPIAFTFNGIALTAHPGMAAADLAKQYRDRMRADGIAYWTPERIRGEIETVRARRAALDAHIDKMFGAIADGEPAIIRWLAALSDLGDDTRTGMPARAIKAALERAGYATSDHVYDPAVKHDRAIFARWLIGQAMDCLERDLPPHQIIQKFAEQYEAWPT